MLATRTLPRMVPALVGAGSGLAASVLLFLHLMQSNATLNEAVGNIAPEVAAKFGCNCPFCNRGAAACRIPPEQIGVRRLDGTDIKGLMGPL